MVAAALALVLVGIVLLFFVPILGFVAGAAGLVLFVVWLVGAGRRATNP